MAHTSAASSSRPAKTTTRFRFKAPHRTPRPFHKVPVHSIDSEDDENLYSQQQHGDEAPQLQAKPQQTSPSTKHSLPDLSEPSFSEALFDALSDPDNAAYWTGVYGQPIHIYPRPMIPTGTSTNQPAQSRPMSDAEYTSYVQRRLWENTREGIEASIRLKARERVKRERMEREQRARMRAEKKVRDREMQRERERGDEEREKVLDECWRERVEMYIDCWRYAAEGEVIPWPVPLSPPSEESGSEPSDRFAGKNLEQDIETFFKHLARVQGSSFAAVIKAERVRWHPDKIMQRFGVDAQDEVQGMNVMQRVNEVWRAVDAIWRRLR